MKKVKLIGGVFIGALCVLTACSFVLHMMGLSYHSSLKVETLNSNYAGRITCLDGTYYHYKNFEKQGVYAFNDDSDNLLFESEEIFSLASYRNKLIGLAAHNIYIYDIQNASLDLFPEDKLNQIFTALSISADIGFYDSFRLLADENKVKLYCFDSAHAFHDVNTMVIFPEISHSAEKDTLNIDSHIDEYFFSQNCFVEPLQVNCQNENIVCIAVQAERAGKVNFYQFPFVNEALYKLEQNAAVEIYACEKNERIVYADDREYRIYDHQNSEYRQYSLDHVLLDTVKCKKLKHFEKYTYQLCNGKIFVLNKNYEIYDSFAV